MKNTAHCRRIMSCIFCYFKRTMLQIFEKHKQTLNVAKCKYLKNVENISKIVLTNVELSGTI